MSFDELLNVFMDAIQPADFKARLNTARVETSRRAVAGAATDARTTASVPPGAGPHGMERAFRLFQMGRMTR